MEDSPIRKTLGGLSILISIIIGFMQSSFLWGIGAFTIINLVVAPLISMLERKRSPLNQNVKTSNPINHKPTNKNWKLRDFKEYWLGEENKFKSLEVALEDYYKILVANKELNLAEFPSYGKEHLSLEASLKMKTASVKLFILKANKVHEFYSGEDFIKFQFYKEHLEDESLGRSYEDRVKEQVKIKYTENDKNHETPKDSLAKNQVGNTGSHIVGQAPSKIDSYSNSTFSSQEEKKVDYWLELSMIHFKYNETKESISVLKKGLKEYPNDSHIHFKIAIGYFQYKQHEYALNHIDQAIRLSITDENVKAYSDLIKKSDYSSLSELYIKTKIHMESNSIDAQYALEVIQENF